jgi:hypothetical protein
MLNQPYTTSQKTKHKPKSRADNFHERGDGSKADTLKSEVTPWKKKENLQSPPESRRAAAYGFAIIRRSLTTNPVLSRLTIFGWRGSVTSTPYFFDPLRAKRPEGYAMSSSF